MNSSLAISILLLLSLPTIIQIYLGYFAQILAAKLYPLNVSDQDSFDFIIVGAGSAGSPVAARLIENDFKVLLVEAGPPIHYLQNIPGLHSTFVVNSPYTWKYITQPQKHTFKTCREQRAI